MPIKEPTFKQAREAVRPTNEAPEDIETVREAAEHLPRDTRSLALTIIAVLAVLFALNLAAEFVVPILLAMVLNLLLQPGVRFFTMRLRFPRSLAALIMVLALASLLAGVAGSLSVPAADWIAKAPQSLPALQERLQFLRGPLSAVQHAIQQVGQVGQTEEPGKTVAVDNSSLGRDIGSYVFAGTRTLMSGLFTTAVVLFFLLAAGDTFLRRLVEILPKFSDKKRAVDISYEIERNVSGYLITITIMNTAVGIATGTVMWLCGLPDPLLWGVIAFVLNYVPILGPLTGIVIFFFAGLLALSWPWPALVAPGAYLVIHLAEGETITPMLLARRFTLNPVLVIISLFFWHWMWGVPGALLSVPLLAIFKVVCDRVEPLMPLGHFMGMGREAQ